MRVRVRCWETCLILSFRAGNSLALPTDLLEFPRIHNESRAPTICSAPALLLILKWSFGNGFSQHIAADPLGKRRAGWSKKAPSGCARVTHTRSGMRAGFHAHTSRAHHTRTCCQFESRAHAFKVILGTGAVLGLSALPMVLQGEPVGRVE